VVSPVAAPAAAPVATPAAPVATTAGPDRRVFDYRTNRYIDPTGTTSASQAPQAATAKPLVKNGTFADTTGVPAQILAARQAALQGFTAPEMVARREQSLSGIEGTRATAANDLQRRQNASGTTGGIAFAQQQALNNSALQARAGAERDLFLANEAQRRQALGDLQGYVGGERYGNISTDLAGRQLEMQQSGQDQTAQYQQGIIDLIRQRQTGELPGSYSPVPQSPTEAAVDVAGRRLNPSNYNGMGVPGGTAGRDENSDVWWQPQYWSAPRNVVV